MPSARADPQPVLIASFGMQLTPPAERSMASELRYTPDIMMDASCPSTICVMGLIVVPFSERA